MAASVLCACRVQGSLKAPTPLLTASTPVMAVQPAANARNSSQSVTASVPSGTAGGATTGVGLPPVQASQAPAARTKPRLSTNT